MKSLSITFVLALVLILSFAFISGKKKGNFLENVSTTCTFENPDISVIGIYLDDVKSTVHVLDSIVAPTDFLEFRHVTPDNTSYLNLTTHPGNIKNQISIFEVGYTNEILKHDSKLPVETIKTGKGITLGKTKKEIITILGTCFTPETKNNITRLKYKIDISSQPENMFLKKYNMPVYFAEYDFKEDILIRFQFGFEYP